MLVSFLLSYPLTFQLLLLKKTLKLLITKTSLSRSKRNKIFNRPLIVCSFKNKNTEPLLQSDGQGDETEKVMKHMTHIF